MKVEMVPRSTPFFPQHQPKSLILFQHCNQGIIHSVSGQQGNTQWTQRKICGAHNSTFHSELQLVILVPGALLPYWLSLGHMRLAYKGSGKMNVEKDLAMHTTAAPVLHLAHLFYVALSG